MKNIWFQDFVRWLAESIPNLNPGPRYEFSWLQIGIDLKSLQLPISDIFYFDKKQLDICYHVPGHVCLVHVCLEGKTRIQCKWWYVTSVIRRPCSVLPSHSLTRSLASSEEGSCHVVRCPLERHLWQGTKGGLWLTALEELRPQSNNL